MGKGQAVVISALMAMMAIMIEPQPTSKETYWRLVASYHAQNAALQASYTSSQKAMQEKMSDLSKEIGSARSVIQRGCEAKGGTFEVTDTDIVCKDKTDANKK